MKELIKPNTLLGWINTLPPAIRDYVHNKAIDSFKDCWDFESLDDLKCESLSEALRGAFSWGTGDRELILSVLRKYSNKAPIQFFQFN
jgi:hypothetical protein